MLLDITPVLDSVKTYADAAEQIFAAKDELVTTLETENAELQAQVENAQVIAADSVAAITGQLEAANAELTAIRESLGAAPDDTRVTELTGRVAGLEAELKSVQGERDRAQARVQARDATITKLEAALAKKD